MHTRCFANGIVRTGDPRQPLAGAVVTRGNRIAFVGTTPDAKAFASSEADVVDLGGRLMLPGFIDDHTHFVQGGMHLQGINLRECKSADAFTRTVRDYASAHQGTWITGGDWDHESWDPPALPRKEWIDECTRDSPVFVNRLDGHMALANSAALRQAGITASTPDPDGGLIERDPVSCEPTGILKDAAMEMVLAVVPCPTTSDYERAVLVALEEARKNGVTSIHDITLPDHLPAFRSIEAEGRLTCRVYTRLPIAGYKNLIAQGITHGSGSDRLKLGSLKAFSDGSLGSGTALFFDPYAGEPGHCGLAMDILTNGQLRTWALDADRHGLQLSVHAIGDKANHLVLSLFEEIVQTNPPWDRRFRIEHAQHVRVHDVRRFADLGVIASAQPYHCIDDGVWAEKRIGPERIRMAYAFRSFLDAGVRLCFGSDWTVAPLNPLAWIYAAVTRRTLDGKNPNGWVPDQKISVEDAIRCSTLQNAYASYQENSLGSIETGKLADLVVLDRDIATISPELIAEACVEMTIFDGEVIYTV